MFSIDFSSAPFFGPHGNPCSNFATKVKSERLAFLVASFARRFLDFHLLIHDIAYHIYDILNGKMMYVS